MQSSPITLHTWSFSRLQDFESCKFKAKLKYIDKIPEPERPLPKGKKEHANDRGTRIHEAAEHFINGTREDLISELITFQKEFEQLRALFSQGKVSLEGEWGVNKDWVPCAWDDPEIWARIKLDAFVQLNPTHAVVIDYKTGKKSGNEIKHGEQTQLYQLATFLRYPELETIDTELWYTDQEEVTRTHFSRAQGLKFFTAFNNRGLNITQATEFPPNPNRFSCQWCPYSIRGTGDCEVGV